jgi:hypothetical protein
VRLTDIKITGYVSKKRDVTSNNLKNLFPGASRVMSSETFSARLTKKHFPSEVGG